MKRINIQDDLLKIYYKKQQRHYFTKEKSLEALKFRKTFQAWVITRQIFMIRLDYWNNIKN